MMAGEPLRRICDEGAFARTNSNEYVKEQRQADRPVEQDLPHDSILDQAYAKANG